MQDSQNKAAGRTPEAIKGRCLVKTPQSVTVWPTAQDHLNHDKLIAVPLDLVVRGLHNTQSPQGYDATENIS